MVHSLEIGSVVECEGLRLKVERLETPDRPWRKSELRSIVCSVMPTAGEVLPGRASQVILTDQDGNRFAVISGHAPSTPTGAATPDMIVRPVPLTPLEKLRRRYDELGDLITLNGDSVGLNVAGKAMEAIREYLESAGVR